MVANIISEQGAILTASTDFFPIPTMSLRGPATQHLKPSAKRKLIGRGAILLPTQTPPTPTKGGSFISPQYDPNSQ